MKLGYQRQSGSKNIERRILIPSPNRADSPTGPGFLIVLTGRPLHEQIQHLDFPSKEGVLNNSLVLSNTIHDGLEKEMLRWDSEGEKRPRSLSQGHIELPTLPLSYTKFDRKQFFPTHYIYVYSTWMVFLR